MNTPQYRMNKSALYKIELAKLATGEHNTIFVAQSAVDAELAELAGLASSQVYPSGKIGNLRVQVVPDINLANTTLNWSEYTGEVVKKGDKPKLSKADTIKLLDENYPKVDKP